MRVIIEGENPYSTIIKLKDNANCNLIHAYNADDAGLWHLKLDGNKKKNTNGNGIVIKGNIPDMQEGRCRRMLIWDCKIEAFPENGIRKYFSAGLWRIMDVRIDYCGQYGIYNEATDADCFNIHMNQNEMGGLYEKGANMHYFYGKLFFNGWRNPDSGGLMIIGGRRISVSGLELQDNYYNGVRLDKAYDVHLSNILCDGNGASARKKNVNIIINDTINKSYGYKITNSKRITVYGQATNYIHPTG